MSKRLSPSERAADRAARAHVELNTPPATASAEPVRDALRPTSIYGQRKQILISTEQEARIKRLAYEKGLRETEVVRRMIDYTPDDAV